VMLAETTRWGLRGTSVLPRAWVTVRVAASGAGSDAGASLLPPQAASSSAAAPSNATSQVRGGAWCIARMLRYA
jgi:hypothetical protein